MRPGKYDLQIDQGSALDLIFTVNNPDSETPMNLTGYGARLQVREYAESPVALLSLSVGDGITLGGALGTVRLQASATVTAGLDWEKAVYDLELVPAGNDALAFRLLGGKAILTREVSR